jgi:prepilin-type N-terminal cleavage/methylation domain-containing protein
MSQNLPKRLPKRLPNRRGFTLVELLVGVAIFAIIITPLIHAFVTAQAASGKSHTLGDATLAARNIIEEIKANGAQWAIAEYSSDLSEYSAGTSTFDVRVTVARALDPRFAGINEKPVTDYSPMHGIFAQPAGFACPDDSARRFFRERIELEHDDDDDDNDVLFDPSLIQREILVTVRRHTHDTITVTYSYFYPGLSRYELHYEIYRETMDSARKSVYICFTPHTNLAHRNIIIDNAAGMNLNVFLVNQGDITHTPAVTEIGSNLAVYANFIGDGYLVTRTPQNRMYTVSVDVFNRRTGQRLLTMNATQLD